MAAFSSIVITCLGVLMPGLGLVRGDPLCLAIGGVAPAAGVLGLVLHPRRRRRDLRELEAFEELFPVAAPE